MLQGAKLPSEIQIYWASIRLARLIARPGISINFQSKTTISGG
jgi:hypothetical protein